MAGSPIPPVVSFQNDIVPLFRPMDIQCMRGMGVLLIDYSYMSQIENASRVLKYLTSAKMPRMPYGGPYWSDKSIQLFQAWMDA